MDKGKKIYFSVLILITIFISTFFFSYAIFSNTREEHGKLNIVAGTLNYKINGNDIENNSIEVPADTVKNIILTVTSLNKIDSKYELYYQIDNSENVEVGYDVNTKDSTKGVIEKNGSKEITVIIKNNSSNKAVIKFGVHGGFISEEYDNIEKYGLALNKLTLNDLTLAYNYTGSNTKPKTFPNKGNGYEVASVSCTGADGTWDNVNWSVSLKNITSSNIECTVTFKDEVKENYGGSIQTTYQNIYTSLDPTNPVTTSTSYDSYYSGNFFAIEALRNLLWSNRNIISSTPHTTLSEYSAISSGDNTYDLKETINKWVMLFIYGSMSSKNFTISNFKLNFKDGSTLTVQEAINKKYIEPLAIISSSYLEQKYVFQDFYNCIVTGGSCDGYYSRGVVVIRITNKSALTGCSLTSSVDFVATHDGIGVYEFADDLKISTEPLG